MTALAKNELQSRDSFPPEPVSVSPHRWTLDEYQQMGDAGLLDGCRTELIDGEILDVAPQNNQNRFAVSNVFRLVAGAFDKDDYWVTCRSTFLLAEGQAPEPSVAVELPQPLTASSNVIVKPLLVIEVSDATLLYDQRVKSRLYASCGVADYWIVNLVDRQLEVYRQPSQDASGKWQYAQPIILRPADKISPLCKPDASFSVAEMFT